MRSASSYRGARRNAAKETGEGWDAFQNGYWGRRAKRLAAMETKAMRMSPEQAREALGRWAASGGKDVVSVTEMVPKKETDK